MISCFVTMGSKVLKNTIENSLCLRVFSIAPVGHSVHLKKSCGLAYQTSPAPVISKSRVTLNSSKGSSRKGYGATRHTQSCRKKIVRDIRQDIGYDIGYDITYKSQISGMISGMIFPKKKSYEQKGPTNYRESNTRLQTHKRLCVPLSHCGCKHHEKNNIHIQYML